MASARDKIRALTPRSYNCIPIGEIVGHLNRFLRGWATYFGTGYPSVAFRKIDDYVRERMYYHLKHRSQRSFKPPEGVPWNQVIHDHLRVVEIWKLL